MYYWNSLKRENGDRFLDLWNFDSLLVPRRDVSSNITYETLKKDGRFHLEVVFPGAKKEEIEVYIENKSLFVKAPKTKWNEKIFFEFLLPEEGVVEKEMVAEYDNGVISVFAPLKNKEELKKLPIQVK